ncbi:MAG: cell surface protein SprA [Bacteroidales bacterium]|nr:cell surface protein SprA [Bacteroidales bacterium]
MKQLIKHISKYILIILLGIIINYSFFTIKLYGNSPVYSSDTIIELPYHFNDNEEIPFTESKYKSGLYLNNPSNIQSEIVYDPISGEYKFSKKIGNINYRTPYTLSFDEYRKYDFQKSIKDYWTQRARSEKFEQQSSLIPKLHVGGEVFETIFGSNTINIRPQGSSELTFGLKINKQDNPQISEKLRTTTTFDFKEKIQMNVTGKIGENLEIGVNYNTEATFEFDNKMNLKYEGQEDDIIRKIEAGNVSLPLPGSLITGSQSLFGILTELQFGRLSVTSIFSQQKGETSVIEVEGGAQKSYFEMPINEYDANRHFFLGQYFKESYDEALEDLTTIKSRVNITKIEVWITNTSGISQQTRDFVAFMDLGEGYSQEKDKESNIFANYMIEPNDEFFSQYGFLPDSSSNNLYDHISAIQNSIISNVSTVLTGLDARFSDGQDYEKIITARKLNQGEYKINRLLGYISLNMALKADEVLAVAYEYTIGNSNKLFKIGDFSDDVDAPSILILKLLKGTSFSPMLPTWELMMKNIYSLGAYQLNKEDFRLDILYHDDSIGAQVFSIKEGIIKGENLLRVLHLDELNSQLLPVPGGDGVFDFVDGITINRSNGRFIFPVLEPFGSYLKKQFEDENNPDWEDIADKYIYQELYDSTQTKAQQVSEKNKFSIKGEYKASGGSEISLNSYNLQQGSVTVTAGGMILTEGQDYTVDYMLGRVKIMNQGLLESNTPITISLESNSLFSFQTKTLLGTHLDYRFSDNFNIGGTILNLTERPLTTKVNIGDEPISNTIWGLDGNYRFESRFITKMVDKLPFLETKEISSVNITGEFAHFIPGHSKAIEKSGTAYIDDFEGTRSSIDIRSMAGWKLASTPPDIFPEGILINDLEYGYNRAKLAWYNIDPLFFRTKAPVSTEQQSSAFVREVKEKELFPNKDNEFGQPINLSIFNLSFYPKEKGPYNYNTYQTDYSDGISSDGYLINPSSRWGGIIRKLNTTDFEAYNIEFIEFWLMDPFVYDSLHTGGYLYFNLGNISEDVLKDSRKSIENALPAQDSDTNFVYTPWGKITTHTPSDFSFVDNSDARQRQDVGLDGLNSFYNYNNNEEANFFETYLDDIKNIVDPEVQNYNKILNDPSGDDFEYFRSSNHDGSSHDILERYKNYNGLEGNTQTSDLSTENYPTVGTLSPDMEDINKDHNLSENESYYQYKIKLSPDELKIGQNYITDKKVTYITLKNNKEEKVTWYQFKIPIYKPNNVYGAIQDFQSIRFLRMFLTGFEKEVILRFAKLELVRGEWRKYNYIIQEGDESISEDTDQSLANFDISAINIEENGSKYVLPPGITRITDPSNPHMTMLNEQSIVLKVTDLHDGYSKAAYKTAGLDIRQYKKLEMEIHAEPSDNQPIDDYELSAFIRIGTDYQNNYYEYEVPLIITPTANYAKDNSFTAEMVWPEENRFDIEFLSTFLKVKQERNNKMREEGSNIFISTVYEIKDGKNKIRIKGNPNLSNIRTIMIGIRNPKQKFNNLDDDGMPKSVEVWLNELRLTDFKESGGWAANAMIQTRLADFATVTLAGNTSTPGFGSIDKKINERKQEHTFQYDLASNIELGKFFPDKVKIRIPMYIGFSERKINPYYNPLDPDIPLEVTLKDSKIPKHDRDSIKNISQDYTRRKSINFTNVQINKTKGKPKLYSISNFSVSYSFSEQFSHNINTESNILKNYSGSLNYIFNNSPKNIVPFKKVKMLSKPIFRLIKDFNFYYIPSQLAFRTNMNRKYSENTRRNISNTNQIFDPTFDKTFDWSRIYDLKFNLTKSLKFSFTANNLARIDEPPGRIDKDYEGENIYGNEYDYDSIRTAIWDEIKYLGTTTNYNHRYNLNYNIPINKIPLFNWVTASANYEGRYEWNIARQTMSNNELGNTIKNANKKTLTSQFNFDNLYSKVGFLDKIKKKYKKSAKQRKQEKKYKDVTFEKNNVSLKANVSKSVYHKLNTEDIDIKAYDEQEKEIEGRFNIINENKATYTAKEDHKNIKIIVTGQREIKENPAIIVAEQTARVLMGVKNIAITVSENNGMDLPGYMIGTKYLGMKNVNGTMAPGYQFILGFQDENFPQKVITNDWYTKDVAFFEQYKITNNNVINLRSVIEPIPGLRIDLIANQNFSENQTKYFLPLEDGSILQDEFGNYISSSQMVSGNYSMSFITWNSAFESLNDDYSSDVFNLFIEYTENISNRLAHDRAKYSGDENYVINLDTSMYNRGYGKTSQDVIIPAFLAAYSGTDPDKIPLNNFPSWKSIKPNWKITYDGLTKIEFIKKYIRSFKINHVYSSSYSINNYVTNLDYIDIGNGYTMKTDNKGNYFSEVEISGFNISEQFKPLIGFDMTWNNSLISRLEFQKSRNLSMSLSNNQLTERSEKKIIVGLGYRFKEVEIIINSGSGQRAFKSDLNLRFDFAFSNNYTILRKMIEGINELQTGDKSITLDFTADYVLSERFNLQLFYKRYLKEPKKTITYRTVNANFGITFRFILIQ